MSNGTFYLIAHNRIINRNHIIDVEYLKGGLDSEEGVQYPDRVRIVTTQMVRDSEPAYSDKQPFAKSAVIWLSGQEALDVWNQFFDKEVIEV